MTAIAGEPRNAFDARSRYWLNWERLEARLAELGLPVSVLTERAGLSESTISRLRTRTVCPSVTTLRVIAELVDLPMQELLIDRAGAQS